MLHSVDATQCRCYTVSMLHLQPATYDKHGQQLTPLQACMVIAAQEQAGRGSRAHAPESRVPPSVLPSTITQMTTAPRQPHDSALEAIQTAFMLQQDA